MSVKRASTVMKLDVLGSGGREAVEGAGGGGWGAQGIEKIICAFTVTSHSWHPSLHIE